MHELGPSQNCRVSVVTCANPQAGQIFRGGFLVPPEEAQVLTDRARSTVETGPWVPFRDEDLKVGGLLRHATFQSVSYTHLRAHETEADL
eukprot:2165162-Amphidinium_carterae.1